jgi:ATP-dependent helicase/nuclease subunit A
MGMVRAAAADATVYLSQRSEIWREKGFYQQADESENDRIEFQHKVQAITKENVILPVAATISVKAKGAPNRESLTMTNRANKCLDDLRGCEGDFAAKITQELRMEAEDGRFFIDLTRIFMSRYSRAKRAKNLIDHDDTMHFALKALSVDEVAARYRGKYAHVFVDEYQDINEAQHTIITKIQRDNNDFLVGDVKQCIYTFRESNPDLLIRRCHELKADGLIEMNTNYRSMPGVIRFINGVMRHMMTEDVGGVNYIGGQCLQPGSQGEGKAEIILAQREDEENVEAEAREIGAQIRKLLEQGYAYGDIAILRPEITQSGRRIAKALADTNIPICGGAGSADAGLGELAVFLNALKLIHSETDDVAMLSVMRYPHFGFTEPELALIRLGLPNAGFCSALRAFEQDSALGKKVKVFRDTFAQYRRLAACMKLPDFLMRLRLDMRLRDYALTSPGGAASEAAISAFISEAAAMGAHSLADVLAVADRLGRAKETQQNPAEANGVYLTTIHKSKGLEFRAVILSGLHKKIDQRDTYGSVLVGRDLGLALDILDEATHIRRPTLLYVGMTRAIERLVILGAGCEIKDKWTLPKTDGWQHGASTYFDLLMPAVAMMCADDGLNLEDIVHIEHDESAQEQKKGKHERLAAFWEQAAAQTPKTLFEGYAHKDDIGVPSKVSVSALKRMQEPQVLRPMFAPSSDDGIDAAQRGTLMHRIMEHIGLEPKNEAEVEASIAQMAQKCLIDYELVSEVDAVAVSRFLQSDIAARARRAGMLRAEQPFCLRMSAKEAGLNDTSLESVVVQGVIDMCFVEDGKWIIVDYKTDRVSKAEAAQAARKYAVQLDLYAKALSRITHMDVAERYIYYLKIGEAIRL